MIRDRIAGTGILTHPGSGPTAPLVLLHGVGSDAESWSPMLKVLDPAFEAMAWDAPGYGQSEPLPQAWPTPDDYAARLTSLLDTLGWNRVFLAGHSLGCLFAVRFAASHPERVIALALMSPALGYGVTPGSEMPPNVQARIDDLNALGPADFAAKRASRLLHRADAKPEILAGVRRAMAAVNPGGYAQAVRTLAAGRLLDDAARISVPALVAVGAEDVVTPPANAHAVRDKLVGARPLEIVPDAGHALPQEAPGKIAGLLTTLMLETRDV